MDYRQELNRFFTTCNGKETPAYLYFDLYMLICSFPESDQHRSLGYIFDNDLFSKMSGAGHKDCTLFTPAQAEQSLASVKKIFMPMLERMINSQMGKNEPTDAFYHLVWREIRNTTVLSYKLERACAFYLFMTSDYVPYGAKKSPVINVQSQNNYGEDCGFSVSESCKMIENCLKNCSQTLSMEDVFLDVYTMIVSSDSSKQHLLFACLWNNYETLPTTGKGRPNNPLLTDAGIAAAREKAVKAYLPSLVQEYNNLVSGLNEADYSYAVLWKDISLTPDLSSDLERAVAMFELISQKISFSQVRR